MSKTPIFIIVLVIIAGGIYVYEINKDKLVKPSDKTVTNGEMLATASSTSVVTEEVSYFLNARGYFAKPEAPGSYPGVVMIHENRGLNEGIKSMARELAKEGYMVLAVDLLGKSVETQEEARELTSKFDQATGVKNMRQAVGYLKKKGATKIASLGWCFGGKQSIELSISGEKLDSTVVYYGGGMATSTERLAPIKWPVLGIFGDKDAVLPVEMVKQFESSLDKLGVENEIYIYPGVEHAFANPSGANYAPKETKDAWEKTLAFLNKNLK